MSTDNNAVLGISIDLVRAWGDSWSDGGLWDDIARLAELAWDSADERERLLRWHHLVMAVGNFKRQSNRRLRPCSIESVTVGSRSSSRSDSFAAPGLAEPLFRDELESWKRLEKSLKGSGTATTTTLLAALWPDSHHVLDWRVLAAVAGLGAFLGGDADLGLVPGDSEYELTPDLDMYAEVRTMLAASSRDAGLTLATTERALYRLTQQIHGKGSTWRQYGERLTNAAEKIQRIQPVATGIDSALVSGDSDGPADDEQDAPPSAP
jgi:hypothetical protein